MFQNIEPEFDEIDNEEIEKNNNFSKIKEFLIKTFSIRNIIYYLVCFGVSMIRFGEGISPFGIAMIAASISNKMTIGITYIVCAVRMLFRTRWRRTTYVFINYSCIYYFFLNL